MSFSERCYQLLHSSFPSLIIRTGICVAGASFKNASQKNDLSAIGKFKTIVSGPDRRRDDSMWQCFRSICVPRCQTLSIGFNCEGATLNIACLGWGSLLWEPGSLPLAGEWYGDGPALPIEFCRVGDGGELSTAICMNASAVKVSWALLDAPTVQAACAALRAREQIPEQREGAVGSLLVLRTPIGPLMQWAAERRIDAVVWTALPPRFADIEGRILSANDAVAYLSGLTGDTREHARNYFMRVPEQIDTPYRRIIKRQLGWHSE
ncbi:hypothetical protein [Pseudomonas viridiflava]|uniref:hypothetical protein n=1 Tax=Pseudomonas viridiflava TaxID=33069 RepID=UPI0021591DFB|nr:hypothetical protein [Pseudomonas viridiflava]